MCAYVRLLGVCVCAVCSVQGADAVSCVRASVLAQAVRSNVQCYARKAYLGVSPQHVSMLACVHSFGCSMRRVRRRVRISGT